MRRLYVHEKNYEEIRTRLVKAYKSVKIGDPLDSSTTMGPMHTLNTVNDYVKGIEDIKKEGGKIIYGGNLLPNLKGYYVEPTVVEIDPLSPIVNEELFAPVLYLFKFKTFD